MSQSRSLLAGYRALATLAALGAAGACNYDFDEFSGLAPPLLDSGLSTKGGAAGAAGAGPSDATGGAPGKGGAAGGAGAPDAGKGGGAGGAGGTGAAGTGSGGNAGSSGATGSGGAGGAGAAGGNAGAGGTAGSSGSGGAGAGGGTAGAAGAGATGGASGTGGSGGSTVDAGVDGAGGGGTGGTGAGGTGTGGAGTGSGGTAGTGTGGASGAGTGGTGTSGAAGTGGTGTGGAGTGGTAGVPPPPDGGTRPDIRVADIKLDRVDPPFDCAAVGGRIYEKHCYYAKTTPVTWEVGAKESCPAPAHLVTITSPGEQTFVVSFLTDESRWIGYYRPTGSPKSPSAFEWITGEMSTFSNWYASNGEPDYDGECVRLGPSNNWGDNPCSAAFPVICERE